MVNLLDRLTAALADRYRIERELGAGGMATVYLAEDLKHQRKVAVKVVRPELSAILGAERFLGALSRDDPARVPVVQTRCPEVPRPPRPRFLEGKHWTKAHLAGLETLTATTSRSRSRMARRSTPWARSARIRARYGAARNGVVGRVTAGAVSANTACRRPASGTGPVSRWWVVAQTRYRRTVLRLTPRVAANRPLAMAEVQSPRHLTNVQHVSFPSRHGPSQSKTPGAVLGHADRGKPTAGPLSGEK